MNSTYQYIANYINKPTIFCYILDRVVNNNPYLFTGEYNKKLINKKVWMAKQVFPHCEPTQYTYFKTFKEAKDALNRWARSGKGFNMTYRELLNKLQCMTISQLNSDITVYDNNGEYFRSTLMFSDKTCDVLDEGHPIIAVVNANATFVSGQYKL